MLAHRIRKTAQVGKSASTSMQKVSLERTLSTLPQERAGLRTNLEPLPLLERSARVSHCGVGLSRLP